MNELVLPCLPPAAQRDLQPVQGAARCDVMLDLPPLALVAHRLLVPCRFRVHRRVVDPEAADALAKADQAARIAAFGGREAILARGSFGYSPPPGAKPVFN